MATTANNQSMESNQNHTEPSSSMRSPSRNATLSATAGMNTDKRERSDTRDLRDLGDSSNIHEIGENLREESSRVIDRVSNKAREFSDQAPERARYYYDRSMGWVRNNYRSPLFIAGAVGVVGLLSFLAVRSFRDRSDFGSYDI